MSIARRLWAASLLALLASCNQAQPPKPTAEESPASSFGAKSDLPVKNSKPPADLTANEVLQQLLATYRQAKTYRDNAVIRLAFRRDGQPVQEDVPVAVAFERPGKISIIAFQATVKCDGKELKARIDEPPNNLDGQIVVRPAPQKLTLTEFASDELLYDTLCSRLRRQPIQLELLLESAGLVAAFGSDIACQRLDDAVHGSRACFRVEVPSPGGAFVFWVDQADLLLKRLDYPALSLVPEFIARDPAVSTLELYADLRSAEVNQPIPAAQFTLDVPPAGKRVQRFARPPQPLPSNLFSKQPQPYFFTRLDGSRLKDSDLHDKISVLAWYHDNPACEATLQQVSQAAERLAAESSVTFFAVATDPTAASNNLLQQRLHQWNVNLPIVRDLEAFGDKSFHIDVQPTIVVLDQRGVVQIVQVGGSPELANQLVAIVERLKRGDDLSAGVLAQHEREQRTYADLLARGGPDPRELIEVPEAVIRARSEPKKVQIKPLWTNKDIKQPGNILVTEGAEGSPRIFVLDLPRSVAEISPDGKLVARQALEIPEQAAVTFARTATDNRGQRYFVGSAPLAPQFFVFDGNWKLLLGFPPSSHAPLAIMDLTLVDLDEPRDAPEILVASATGAGVAALSLTGEVRWRDRTVPNALSAVASTSDVGSKGIFVAGDEAGSVVRLNRSGNAEPASKIGNWLVGRMLAAPFVGQNHAALVALSTNAKTEPYAVGLTHDLRECWNYPLPPGVHQQPIEPVQSSHVLKGYGGEWWLAGPDGSIHVITADGQLFDSFNFGAPLNGLAATKIGDRAMLLVATSDGLSAWEIQAPGKARSSREY